MTLHAELAKMREAADATTPGARCRCRVMDLRAVDMCGHEIDLHRRCTADRIAALCAVAEASAELDVADDPSLGSTYRKIAQALKRLAEVMGT